MDRWAIIKNGIIKNIIVADKTFIDKNYPDAILCDVNVSVGDGYNETDFYLIRDSQLVPEPVIEEDDSETL